VLVSKIERVWNTRWTKGVIEKGSPTLRVVGGRVGATRTYACGEGTGGVSSKEGISYPSLKQESPCGSSGWGDNLLPEDPSVRAK